MTTIEGDINGEKGKKERKNGSCQFMTTYFKICQNVNGGSFGEIENSDVKVTAWGQTL